MLIVAVMTAIVAATAGDGNEKQTLVRDFKSPLKYCSSKNCWLFHNQVKVFDQGDTVHLSHKSYNSHLNSYHFIGGKLCLHEYENKYLIPEQVTQGISAFPLYKCCPQQKLQPFVLIVVQILSGEKLFACIYKHLMKEHHYCLIAVT